MIRERCRVLTRAVRVSQERCRLNQLIANHTRLWLAVIVKGKCIRGAQMKKVTTKTTTPHKLRTVQVVHRATAP